MNKEKNVSTFYEDLKRRGRRCTEICIVRYHCNEILTTTHREKSKSSLITVNKISRKYVKSEPKSPNASCTKFNFFSHYVRQHWILNATEVQCNCKENNCRYSKSVQLCIITIRVTHSYTDQMNNITLYRYRIQQQSIQQFARENLCTRGI